MSAIPVTRRLVILGHITEEADDAERQTFMQVIPAPARLAYKLIGHRQFTRETTTLRGCPSSRPGATAQPIFSPARGATAMTVTMSPTFVLVPGAWQGGWAWQRVSGFGIVSVPR